MRYSDIDQPKVGVKGSSGPLLADVPQSVVDAFMRGLDDVKAGRVVDGDNVIAESRALLAAHRANKQKDGSTFTDGS